MRVEPDEKRAADLLRPLAMPPSAPSRVDIARAIADGERLRSRALWVRSGTAAVAVALVLVGGWAAVRPVLRAAPAAPAAQRSAAASSPAHPSASTGPHTPAPPAACSLRRLPLPAGHPAKSIVTGADPTGRYILGRSYPGKPQVLIWHDGKIRTVAITGGDAELEDVTSTGVAVGGSYVGRSAETTAAWVYRDGRVSRLAGHDAWAYGINERQVIVGTVNGRPALWRTPSSQPTMLATPGRGWTGYAAGIDEDGTVVGRLQSAATEPMSGYLWRPDGQLAKLPVPALRGQPVTEYTADDIRNGWVMGWAGQDVGDVKYIGAPLWNLRTGEVDTTDQGQLVEAVNRYGWTVGGRLLVAGDRTVRLPDYGERPVEFTLAYTISDDGSTVAGQVNLKGDPVAVVWRCR